MAARTRSVPYERRNAAGDIAAMSFEDALAELEGIVRGWKAARSKLDDASNPMSAARS